MPLEVMNELKHRFVSSTDGENRTAQMDYFALRMENPPRRCHRRRQCTGSNWMDVYHWNDHEQYRQAERMATTHVNTG
jgi:hypothetical protein